jgi:hypothetical protein
MYYIEKKKTSRSKKYSPFKELPEINDVIHYLATNKLKPTELPYFFTYIPLSDGTIITQKYSGIICSPTDLAEKMKELCLIK